MNWIEKISVLDAIDAVYDRFCVSVAFACRPGCADCCTANVTMTGLEGARLLAAVPAAEQTALFDRLRGGFDRPRFRPRSTTNRIARACLDGADGSDETPPVRTAPCPLLGPEKTCPVYRARPFNCRCMVSKTVCTGTGWADMDDFTLTVNTVFLQVIEHLDADGYSGNLTDVLLALESAPDRLGPEAAGFFGLVDNHPLPALMIPPEHRRRIEPILAELRRIGPPASG